MSCEFQLSRSYMYARMWKQSAFELWKMANYSVIRRFFAENSNLTDSTRPIFSKWAPWSWCKHNRTKEERWQWIYSVNRKAPKLLIMVSFSHRPSMTPTTLWGQDVAATNFFVFTSIFVVPSPNELRLLWTNKTVWFFARIWRPAVYSLHSKQ